MRVRYLRSFDASFKELHARDRVLAAAAISRLLDYFAGKPRPLGIGLRKLKGSYWEIRASLDQRALFLLEDDLVTFVIVGNHDEIRRRLRR